MLCCACGLRCEPSVSALSILLLLLLLYHSGLLSFWNYELSSISAVAMVFFLFYNNRKVIIQQDLELRVELPFC